MAQSSSTNSRFRHSISGKTGIDLGLPSGTLWATRNVGAANDKEFGEYYSWGSTTEKIIRPKENEGNIGLNTDISGNGRYDAAKYNWGGPWRIPTKEEMEELVKYCKWELEKVDRSGFHHSGYSYYFKVTGPNGMSIMLPLAGIVGDPVDGKNQFPMSGLQNLGQYWTSTPSPEATAYNMINEKLKDNCTYRLSLFYDEKENEPSYKIIGGANRSDGLSIRPVASPNR
ncbi:MAG: hypothetical protein J1F38_08565 [Muribaculaceae bacterium]|nr:hypothetical protein [Muribaculaceae bacterium]